MFGQRAYLSCAKAEVCEVNHGGAIDTRKKGRNLFVRKVPFFALLETFPLQGQLFRNSVLNKRDFGSH